MRACSSSASCLTIAAGLAMSASAHAAILTWNLPGNGDAGVAGTWSPAQIPAPGDVLNYNTAGFHSVSFLSANPVPSVGQQNFNAGTYSLANSLVSQTTTGQFVVALTPGSSSTVVLSQGNWFVGGTCAVGGNSTGSGTLSVLSGSMNVQGGTNVTRIGNTGAGTLNVQFGSDFIADGAISIARLSGSTGSATVTGVNGSRRSRLQTLNASTGDLFVAENGPGTLAVVDGALADIADDVFIAPNAGVTGSVTISSATSDVSDLNVVGELFLGANASSGVAAGNGTLTINAGGRATVGGGMKIGDDDGGTGTLSMTSGTLSVGGIIDAVNATLTLNGGTITATDLNLRGTTTLAANGRINADLSPAFEFSNAITLTGPLDVGRDGASGSVSTAGSWSVGSHALTIRGTVTSRLGNVTLAGGSINAADCEIHIANGDSLTGFGTINAPFAVASGVPVVATGVGLTFNSSVSQFIATLPMNFSGTKFFFGPTSSFSGKGTIAAPVETFPGAVITATGDLTMGADTPFGVVLNGATLNVGPHHVTFNDSNGLPVGNSRIDGGTLELVGTFAGRLLNTNSGSLSGRGTIVTPLFSNHRGGVISPGAGAATGVGTLSFSGAYISGDASNPAGTLNIELGGPIPSSHDRIVAQNNATLAGTLNVTLINGYVPTPGVFHDIVVSNTGFVLGDFATRNMPPNFIRVFNGSTYSVGLKCPADLDDGEGGGRADGGVDINDLLHFLHMFELGDISADLDDDGSDPQQPDGGVDINDLLFFLAHFELGC